MKVRDDLDAALDALDGAGAVEVETAGGAAEVDCTEVGPVGVRVRRLRVRRDADVDVVDEATALPDRARTLGEPLEAVEVDGALGGAILRTPSDAMRDREYFELDVRPRHTDVRRVRVDEQGERRPAEFALTRGQLGRLIEEVEGQ